MNEELILKVDNVFKKYRLGTIGGGTLTADIQSWWARIRHKEDPNSKIGTRAYERNEEFYALKGISFEVKKGEALGIIGGNGAGKSTTLKLLSQVTAPTDGKIYLNGRIASMLEVGTGFHPELTGRENIYMNGAILGMTKAEIDSKMEDIIEFSECRQFIDTPVKRYSSGMYVKLAFSVAAHLDSEIMIMDEVLAVGDMAFQQKCINKMISLSKDEGRTILYVSHNMNTIRQLCDRCIVLKSGTVIFEGNADEAISLYLSGSNSNETKREYTKDDHEKWCNNRILLKSAEIKNDINTLFCTDLLKFKIKCVATENANDIKMRLVILNEFGEKIGMSISENDLKFVKDAECEYELSFDTTVMSPGKYSMHISCFKINEFGNHDYYGVINNFMSFTLYDKPSAHSGMNWKTSSWGNIAFPPFRLENI